MKSFFKIVFFIVPIAVGLLLMDSCSKDQIATKGSLSFSTDTLTFDTVFTTLGSTTRYFKVRNTLSQTIRISEIKLMQLSGTQFRIAVDGDTGIDFKNIDIPAHDSIYVFAEVTVNPNNINNPFVITDQIQFVTNGTSQIVTLEAMGQNAYYHINEHIKGVKNWMNDKPHIVVSRNGGLPFLAIDTGATLNLPARCQIYMAAGAVITVDGTLQSANGLTWADSIVFQGIRREASYKDKPGQWLGITYSRIAKVNLNHTIINESTVGISDEHVLNIIYGVRITTSNIQHYATDNTPTVTLDRCIIKNSGSTAMAAFQTNLTATNCLFYAAGGSMILGVGGTYNLSYCTIANVYNRYIDHKNQSLAIISGIQDIDKTFVGPYTTNSTITNTVVYGTLDNELLYSGSSSNNVVNFKYSLLKENIDSFHLFQATDNNCIFNTNPQFKSEYYSNFQPDSTTSPLWGAGTPVAGVSVDLFDYNRPTPPGIGAIEWHQ